MRLVRVAIGLAILASLGAVWWQNASQPLTITFLGTRSQPLSLGTWVIVAVSAGILSGGILLLLLRLVAYSTRQTLAAAERQRLAAEPPPMPAPPAPDEWDIETPPDPDSSPEGGPWPEPEAPIYDADFRVLRSPTGQPMPPPAEDWDIEQDPDLNPEANPDWDESTRRPFRRYRSP